MDLGMRYGAQYCVELLGNTAFRAHWRIRGVLDFLFPRAVGRGDGDYCV
jgi:hypothetical protein